MNIIDGSSTIHRTLENVRSAKHVFIGPSPNGPRSSHDGEIVDEKQEGEGGGHKCEGGVAEKGGDN